MKSIHHRMPVIIPRDLEDKWLDPSLSGTEELMTLLKPYPSELMEAFEVSRAVNSPKNNFPECIKPIGTGDTI
jgi:putative SOS response-associated peptidase YedK